MSVATWARGCWAKWAWFDKWLALPGMVGALTATIGFWFGATRWPVWVWGAAAPLWVAGMMAGQWRLLQLRRESARLAATNRAMDRAMTERLEAILAKLLAERNGRNEQ